MRLTAEQFHDPKAFPTQNEVAEYLLEIAKQDSLTSALEQLNTWMTEHGYFDLKSLAKSPHYQYPCDHYGITFKSQVNLARSRYQPPQLPKNDGHLCPICFEHVDSKAKPALRALPMTLSTDEPFFIIFTPYPIVEQHFVSVTREARPMSMGEKTLRDCANLLERLPGYTLMSNSHLKGAGTSIVSHHHYQGGKGVDLPLMYAHTKDDLCTTINGVEVAMLHYPCAIVRLRSAEIEALLVLGSQIMADWKSLNTAHHSCNILMHQPNAYEAYLILRNNQFQTPPHLKSLKSEGLGIIEMCGEGIFPLPQGDQADQLWEKIENHGAALLTELLQSNSPVDEAGYAKVFSKFGGQR